MLYLILIIAVIAMTNAIRIVPLDTWFIIERMGVYHETWGNAGMHFKFPFVDRIANKVSKQTQSFEDAKHTITSIDERAFEINSSVEFSVIDPIKYTYIFKNSKKINELIITTANESLRNLTSDDIYRDIYGFNEKVKEKINNENVCICIDFLNLKIKRL